MKIENKKRYQVTLSPANIKIIKNIFIGEKLSPIIDWIISDWVKKNNQDEKGHFLEMIDRLEKFRKTNDFHVKENVISKILWISEEMDLVNDSMSFKETLEDYIQNSLKTLQSIIISYEITLIDNLPGNCKNPIMKTLREELMLQQKEIIPKLKEDSQ